MGLDERHFCLHRRQPACPVFSDSLAQLTQAQLHVVEIGNGLTQRLVQVRKLLFKVSEGPSAVIAALGCHLVNGQRVSYVDTHAPVVLPVEIPGLARVCRHKPQYAAVYVFCPLFFQFPAEVTGHRLYIMLQQLHIREDVVVDALQHIVGLVRPCHPHQECVINQAVA